MNGSNPAESQSPSERKRELADLVYQAQQGGADSFEEIVNRTYNFAKKLAYPIVGRQHCEDVLQESYLLAFQKISQVKKPEAFLSWLCRIVLHVSYRVKKKNPPSVELPDSQASPDHTNTVVDAVVLERALAELRPKDKNLLILRELLELSYEEVSQVLRVPVGTVRSRLHKARKLLREKLGR